MKIIDWNDFIFKDHYISSKCAVTIGVFDGLHKGHRYLINQLNDKQCSERVVFTFRDNPARFFNKKNFYGDIYTLSQKLNALKMTGVTTTVLIDFSGDFSKLTGNYFISCISSHLNLVKMVVGEDFKCGKGNDTTAAVLADNYFSDRVNFNIIKRQSFNGFPVSSSEIRSLIKRGLLDQASDYLEFGHAIDLSDLNIDQDRDCFFINKYKIKQVLPEDGNFNMSIIIGNRTFRKKVIIDNRIFKWFKSN